ncbi:hypothetical protein C8K11_10343 [Novosphingobium sp. GV055]|nr:hypothetical protein C8K11_10343 [Novosphingobium sp. GV055]PUB05522.1 hypothetical protein C8K12_10343 [Novosphingobium sp. GV061]PUB21755.1 hypothetical protein C8K14_10343 [Novosphingobium sp. GV079]PUB43528.1 hypothetical protein C8K10_10343 [Novosphingobium sp. GV027]
MLRRSFPMPDTIAAMFLRPAAIAFAVLVATPLAAHAAPAHPSSPAHPAYAVFAGLGPDGRPIRFEDHGTRYRLRLHGHVREGDLNTERGWKSDPDATLYVLDWQGPAAQQTRLVRRTGKRDVLFLDSHDNIARPVTRLARVTPRAGR